MTNVHTVPTTTAPIIQGNSEMLARRYKVAKYALNATMPSALPRAPKRLAYTAANTTTTKTTSPATKWTASSEAAVMESAAGSGSSAIVIRCCRGSASLTDWAAIIVMMTPSNATVRGCPVALVSR